MMDAMEKNSRDVESDEKFELPPGFRFHPTDEELITHYLSQKVLNNSFCAIAIGEADLNKCEPWDLPCKFLFSLSLIPFFFLFEIFLHRDFKIGMQSQHRGILFFLDHIATSVAVVSTVFDCNLL